MASATTLVKITDEINRMQQKVPSPYQVKNEWKQASAGRITAQKTRAKIILTFHGARRCMQKSGRVIWAKTTAGAEVTFSPVLHQTDSNYAIIFASEFCDETEDLLFEDITKEAERRECLFSAAQVQQFKKNSPSLFQQLVCLCDCLCCYRTMRSRWRQKTAIKIGGQAAWTF
jgi:hypothetical protein